jgi:uncharacterized protein
MCFRGLRGTKFAGGAEVPLLIEVRELEAHPVDFDEELEPGAIDFGPDVRQIADLKSAGRAQLVREHHGKHELIKDIRLAGDFSTRVEMACARCVEPINRDVTNHFDLLYRPQGADAGRSELSVTAAEAEVGYYQGEGLLLEDALREQVLLALPLRAVCKDDCKGLCPHCGGNLNQQQCDCAEPLQDPRWSALKEIKEKLKTSS